MHGRERLPQKTYCLAWGVHVNLTPIWPQEESNDTLDHTQVNT